MSRIQLLNPRLANQIAAGWSDQHRHPNTPAGKNGQAAQAGKDIGKNGYRTKTRAKSHANHQHDQCLAGDGYRAWRDHYIELRRSG